MTKRQLYEKMMSNISRRVMIVLNEEFCGSERLTDFERRPSYSIDDVRVSKNTIVIEECNSDNNAMKWMAEISPCSVYSINVDGNKVGRKYGRKYQIEGGEIYGILTLHDVNDIMDGDYYDIEDVPETVAIECIRYRLGDTVCLFMNENDDPTNVYFDGYMLNDDYQNELDEIEFGNRKGKEADAYGIYYARVYSPDIARTITDKLYGVYRDPKEISSDGLWT